LPLFLQIKPTKCTKYNVLVLKTPYVLGLTDPSSGSVDVQNNC
jgi:hypothetical protein